MLPYPKVLHFINLPIQVLQIRKQNLTFLVTIGGGGGGCDGFWGDFFDGDFDI